MNLNDLATFTTIMIAVVFAFLAFCLYQARLANEDCISQIDKFGDDQKGKLSFAFKVLFNFYLLIAACLIVAAAALGLLSREVFLGIFIAVLTAMGVKLGIDAFKS